MQHVLTSLNLPALRLGLRVGQPVRDAHAMCAGLVTRTRSPQAEAAFLAALRRWAGKFSPWVAEEAADALVVDLTGCAHLFGGEEALLDVVRRIARDLGLSGAHAGSPTRGARPGRWRALPGRGGGAAATATRSIRRPAPPGRGRASGGTGPRAARRPRDGTPGAATPSHRAAGQTTRGARRRCRLRPCGWMPTRRATGAAGPAPDG